MIENIKFGIIGCGHIGKRHAAVIDAATKAELVSLGDIDFPKAGELGDLYDVKDTYADFHELINGSSEVVSICTPHFLHKSMTIDALQAGKDVIVEKPMALSTADANEMTNTAKRLNRRLYVVKQNRFNVPIKLAGEAITNNKLGKIFMVECNVLWNRHQAYYDQSDWRGFKEKEGGALFTQASHFIDILVWWFGDVVSANTKIATQNHNIEVEDAGIANVEFSSGVLGAINWTTNVYNKNYEGSITIVAEHGTIKIGGAYLNKIEFWDVESFPLPEDIEYVDLPNNYGKYQGSSSNHHQVFAEIIKDLTGEKSSIVEGWEGTRSIEAIEKIYRGVK
jgi:UDP-N-acetyl-2-amino-2-deoxyglucuronate dehydrogenase